MRRFGIHVHCDERGSLNSIEVAAETHADVVRAAAILCQSPGIQRIDFGNGTLRARYALTVENSDLEKIAAQIMELLEVKQ